MLIAKKLFQNKFFSKTIQIFLVCLAVLFSAYAYNCYAAAPPPSVTGGLVPCGRDLNNPATPWNETADCQLCHFVILADNIVDFLMKMVTIIAVLALVIGGLIYIKSAGNTSLILSAKQNFNKILYGFTVVFIAWVAVNIAMVLFGFSDPLGNGSWAVFDCNVP